MRFLRANYVIAVSYTHIVPSFGPLDLYQIDGEFDLVFGTSASSPVVGAIITAINDARIHAGKSPVGFINPTVCGHLPETFPRLPVLDIFSSIRFGLQRHHYRR